MLGTWAQILEDIPTDELEYYFLLASKAKTNGFAVNANDIMAAWNNRAYLRHNEQVLIKQIKDAGWPPEEEARLIQVEVYDRRRY